MATKNSKKTKTTARGSFIDSLISVKGCLTFTVLAVAVFFIIYIALGTLL